MPLPMGMGLPPMGLPGLQGPPNPAMAALDGLSGVPAPQREQQALDSASAQLNIAFQGVSMRSATAAKHVANALKEIQQAREALGELGMQAVGAPPDLLGSMLPQSQGMPTNML